jgi:hypothetical protein
MQSSGIQINSGKLTTKYYQYLDMADNERMMKKMKYTTPVIRSELPQR